MAAIDRFIQDTLREEGFRMIRYQTRQIQSATTSRTGGLLRNRRIQASSDSLVFSHPAYERYLDMRGRGRKRKSRKIHNRYTFGAYASIAERLAYGFTEEVAEKFRESGEKS